MSDALREMWVQISAYIWFIMLACFGGLANYLSKVRANNQKSFSLVELLGEFVLSGFAGLMTAFFCIDVGFSFEMTAAAAGVAGHMGGRGVYLMEQALLSRLQQQPKPRKDEES